MTTGRLQNKILTTVDGTNTTNSSTHAYKNVEIANIPTGTTGNLQYLGEDDSVNVLSGTGATGISGGAAQGNPPRWGYVSPSGSRVEINDTAGSETVEIIHRSGAGVSIDSDGAIFITSKSQRGGGLNAPFGDIHISAGGDIVIRGGSSLTVQTFGDLNLDVGGTFQVKCYNYNLITNNYDVTVDGPSSTSVTNDNSVVIGGIDRKTVAGDCREQISGNKINDVGGTNTCRIGGDSSTSVGGAHNISSTGNGSITSAADNSFYGGSDVKVTAGGTANLTAGGPVKLSGSIVNATPYVDLAYFSDYTQQAALAVSLGGSMTAKPTAQGGDSAAAGQVADAEIMEANDIVDTLTSARKYPEYMGNGVLESANATGYSTISHDRSPQAEQVYQEYSGGNVGNINPSFSGGSYDHLPETPVNRNPDITPVEPTDISIPAQGDLSAKISKYFTLGQIINGTTTRQRPSPKNWDNIVKQGILLATNVLDPVKQKFPDIIVTSWYRVGTDNHGTGRAIDIVVQSRSMTKHAEIARFARDNLPVDQVFLEKNTSGRTHVHLRVSTGKGNPKVMTCGDQDCISQVPGINVDWLARRAK